MSRIEMINQHYSQYDEEHRLERSRHGQLEYYTTMNYIHRSAVSGAKIIEIGAGTGRYSIPLAKEGYDVTAVELVDANMRILKESSAGLERIHVFQGDATDLSQFVDSEFDITLIFGPMYHLYDGAEVNKAIDEGIRVTREGGVILAAFLSAYAILYTEYLRGNFQEGLGENFTGDYHTKHFQEQLFTGYDVTEFEQLFESKPVEHLTTVSTDSILESAESRADFAMSDEDFDRFKEYHLATCEKRELLGNTNHLLYICKKKS